MNPIHVRLGEVEFDFEPQSGYLRYVRVGSIELIRGIYVAVRKADWGTPVNQLSAISFHSAATEWSAKWDAAVNSGDVKFCLERFGARVVERKPHRD